MKLFNIGIPEALILVIFIFIIMGPGRIVSSARSLGTWFRKISKSKLWHDIVTTSNDIKDLPQKILKESELDQEMKSLREYSTDNSILPEKFWKDTYEGTDSTSEGNDHQVY